MLTVETIHREAQIVRDEISSGAMRESITARVNALSAICHGNAYANGWWSSLTTGEPLLRNDGEMIALMHSELSEALEGLRKNKQDDHLPHRKSVEVELADTLIRIFDYAGAKGLDLGGALTRRWNTTTIALTTRLMRGPKLAAKSFNWVRQFLTFYWEQHMNPIEQKLEEFKDHIIAELESLYHKLEGYQNSDNPADPQGLVNDVKASVVDKHIELAQAAVAETPEPAVETEGRGGEAAPALVDQH